jgi:hypothetical protein
MAQISCGTAVKLDQFAPCVGLGEASAHGAHYHIGDIVENLRRHGGLAFGIAVGLTSPYGYAR